ncbi:MAG: hypothetical protein M1475_01405 [Actinobacteria bacterium]|nr:hypothetical protein [Actinomycetota bacterium]
MDLLKKIKSMTTDIGIYQHGKLNQPNPEFGYALEDQARALIVASELEDKRLQKIYLDFILNAKRKDGLLYHFYYENRDDSNGIFKNEENNSRPNIQEASGITLWSLLTLPDNRENKGGTEEIIKNLMNDAFNWTSPRAISAALLGLVQLSNESNLEILLKKKLHNLYFDSHDENWIWFENYLVYANAIIPWSLWELYLKRNCKTSFEIAGKTTDFLLQTCSINNIPAPVGNKGWCHKGGIKAIYDQQPIDAAYMVCCLEKAYNATSSKHYLDWAKKWYEWFLGNNIHHISLISKDFACFDGLTAAGVNHNQGAESNICFIMAYLAAKRLSII